MHKSSLLVVIVSALAAACATPARLTVADYLCVEHNTHHFVSKDEFCACMNIDPKKYDDYSVFTTTAETGKKEFVNDILSGTRDEMEQRIVSMVMHRIEHAMGKQIIKYWRFDKMDIPVTIRSFKRQDGDRYGVLVAAVMTRYDLSPRGIIMYLPLEYKMHILEKKKGE